MKSFRFGIGWRVALMVLLSLAGAYTYQHFGFTSALLFFIPLVIVTINLNQYAVSVNRKLKRLFESIQYQDFAITFRADNQKGQSFGDLNQELNAVIKSFNQVRAERESIIHFIQAIIQQINVGILSFNTEGKVELSNQAIHKLLGVYKILHISDIPHQEFLDCLKDLSSGQSRLIHLHNNELSVGMKEIILRDRRIRLIAVHNIRSELQNRELEAWQNLTKVLRHEIMNSVTPIVSLSETMQDIVHNDLTGLNKSEHLIAVEDLNQAIDTIIIRSRGIMNFVNAYREFTSIPQPNFRDIQVENLFESIGGLYDHRDKGKLHIAIKQSFEVHIDQDQISQVLINLIKNAFESYTDKSKAEVWLHAYVSDQVKYIEVIDQGSGIQAERADQIFVPFFTTKPDGTGIGLSLSKQIMHLHGGSITHRSNQPQGTRFLLQFV